jgi:hypothetical protein
VLGKTCSIAWISTPTITPSIAAGDVTLLKAKITITGIHANLNNTIMPSADMAKHDRKPIGGR